MIILGASANCRITPAVTLIQKVHHTISTHSYLINKANCINVADIVLLETDGGTELTQKQLIVRMFSCDVRTESPPVLCCTDDRSREGSGVGRDASLPDHAKRGGGEGYMARLLSSGACAG